MINVGGQNCLNINFTEMGHKKMKIKLPKLLTIMLLTLILVFSAGSLLLTAYADLDQPDAKNDDADLSYNEGTGGSKELASTSVATISLSNDVLEDDPIIKADEVFITDKGLGNTNTDPDKWISSNQDYVLIREGIDTEGNPWKIYIKTDNNGRWFLVAEGNVPPDTKLDIYYQYKGDKGSAQVWKATYAINGAGELEIVSYYNTGSGSINQLYIGELEFTKGTIEIIKEVKLLEGVDFVPTAFAFEVLDGQDEVVWEIMIEVDEANKEFSVKADDFSPGIYTVREVGADGYTVTLDPANGQVEISEGAKVTVKAVNEYISPLLDNFKVYLESAQTTLAAGETLYVDVMLFGNLNYTQMNASIAYDNDLLEFAGSENLNGLAAEIKKDGADRISVRNVPSINMFTGAPCAPPIKVATLKFTVKDTLSMESAVTELTFNSIVVFPTAGITGATTAPGKALSVTVR